MLCSGLGNPITPQNDSNPARPQGYEETTERMLTFEGLLPFAPLLYSHTYRQWGLKTTNVTRNCQALSKSFSFFIIYQDLYTTLHYLQFLHEKAKDKSMDLLPISAC